MVSPEQGDRQDAGIIRSGATAEGVLPSSHLITAPPGGHFGDHSRKNTGGGPDCQDPVAFSEGRRDRDHPDSFRIHCSPVTVGVPDPELAAGDGFDLSQIIVAIVPFSRHGRSREEPVPPQPARRRGKNREQQNLTADPDQHSFAQTIFHNPLPLDYVSLLFRLFVLIGSTRYPRSARNKPG